MKEEVEKAIEEIRPHLAADGGDVELVEITDDGIVKVRFMGACAGCPMKQFTLQSGVGKVIMEKVPQVKQVIAV
jgi:Fe-S cluster biogenesis protein NfuA